MMKLVKVLAWVGFAAALYAVVIVIAIGLALTVNTTL